ncbi:MAG: cadmium-translocating P-type ATPase [Clostridia bacterium]|nr:cadmium-translocating P-type ATPase [Clostridia bacterium]
MNNFKIEGLDCANCARELEEEISKIEGVKEASVDFMAQKVYVECDGATLEKVKDVCNHFEEVKVVEEPQAPAASEVVAGEKLNITGLCCANCARELEEDLNKLDGITAAVDFVNMRVILNAVSPEAREKAIYTITHFEDVKIVSDKPARKSVLKEHLKDIILISVAVALFIPALVLDLTGTAKSSLTVEIITYVLYGLSYLTVGHPVLWNTVKNIAKGKIFDENFLMTVASIGAILLGIFAGDGFVEGVAVMLLYQLGELLQGIAVGSSRNSISTLMDLKSDTATLIVDGVQRVVPPEELHVGDTILIKAGEKVPVDCRVTKGESALDMKSLNGEPLPREVKAGEEILSGSINISGVIEAEVLREYKNSAVAKILELVENSTAKKSKPEKFITKFAKYYTPIVCLIAAIVAGIVPTIICAVNASFVWDTYRDWIYNALSFLVISCPCALVISVPLSYFGGIGRCAKFGVLVKGSTCLDQLALSTVAAFDKTGTLTEGVFEVVNFTDEKTLQLAAAAEKFSSHPVAAAFKNISTDLEVQSAEEVAGKGVKCLLNGETLLVGNGKLLNENGVAFEEKQSLSTVIYVALAGKFVGFAEIDDKVKDGAAEALAELKKSGVVHLEMLTGDKAGRAAVIAKALSLDGYKAELLPDEKLQRAIELKANGKLIYVGDGINDAPVMTAADCAVSMGKVGSDAAIEASDIVLVSDNLRLLPKGRRIAKGTRRLVIENIVGSLIVKVAIMALSVALPAFPLIAAIAADVGVMLIAVLNALRTNLIK